MACEHFSWDQRNTDRLIEQWSSKPCLYDPSCADYRDKAKREIAMAEIAGELGTIDSDIRDKMKTLRSQYSRERTHEDKSQSDAERAPGRVPYKSKWMYFARLAFLDEHKRRSLRDDRDLDGEATEQGSQLLAAAMEYVAHDRMASGMSSGGSVEPLPLGGTHLNGLTSGSAAESPDADDTDEAKLMIDPDARTSRDSPAPRPHRRAPLRADHRPAAGLPWSASNGSWHCPPTAAQRRQRMPLLHAAEARNRYGEARARPSRDGARRRESNVAWRAMVLPSSRPAAAVAERLQQPPPALSSHRPLHAASVAALAADSPHLYADGGLDIDLLLRLAETAAVRAVAGCAQQAALEDAESAFGHFIARQLRLLTSGHERQVARLRIHQAMVDALAAADDETSQPPPAASGRGSSCSRS